VVRFHDLGMRGTVRPVRQVYLRLNSAVRSSCADRSLVSTDRASTCTAQAASIDSATVMAPV
jgi:hypothetical protein